MSWLLFCLVSMMSINKELWKFQMWFVILSTIQDPLFLSYISPKRKTRKKYVTLNKRFNETWDYFLFIIGDESVRTNFRISYNLYMYVL